MIKKVQFGAGYQCENTWENYDNSPSLLLRKLPLSITSSKLILKHLKTTDRIRGILRNVIRNKSSFGDIAKGLPLSNDYADFVYGQHVLEHLPLNSFKSAIREVYRILKKGGVFRLVVPNLKYYIKNYLSSNSKTKSIDFCFGTELGTELYPNFFSRLRYDRHHIMYDLETLEYQLKLLPFSNVREAFCSDSEFDVFKEVEEADKWVQDEFVGRYQDFLSEKKKNPLLECEYIGFECIK